MALARPSTIGERRTVATVLLVDVSASIGDRQLAAASKLVEDARAARHGDDVLRLVTFGAPPAPGRAAARRRPAAAADALARHDADGSDLGGRAHARLRPLSAGHAPARASSSPTATRPKATSPPRPPTPRAAACASRYVSFPRAAATTKCWCASLDAARATSRSARRSRSPPRSTPRARRPATLTLYRDEFINPLDGRKQVDARTPAPTWSSGRPRSRKPGFTTFKAVVAAAGKEKLHDTLRRTTTQAVASVAVKGKPRVLYVEGEPAAAPATWPTRSSARTSTSTCAPATACPSSPRELAALRSGARLRRAAQIFVGPAQMAAIEAYVRDLGGGFIMAGGENSFGSGGYTGSRLEKLLPVRFDTEKKRDQPAPGAGARRSIARAR